MNTISSVTNTLRNRTLSFTKDERGLTTVEYVIVLVLIAVGAIGLWTTFGGKVNERIKSSTASVSSMTPEN